MSLLQAAESLMKPGAIGVIPTDTVYGVVARAQDRAAVERLYTLKRREHKPGTLIAASIDQLEALGLRRRYLTAVEQYWPGAISVIIPCADHTLDYLHQGAKSLAVRIPDAPDLLQILVKTDPLLTSSANPPGKPPANTASEAREYFSSHVDFYIDGYNLAEAKPSTVIRIVDDSIEVLRQGAVTINEERD